MNLLNASSAGYDMAADDLVTHKTRSTTTLIWPRRYKITMRMGCNWLRHFGVEETQIYIKFER